MNSTANLREPDVTGLDARFSLFTADGEIGPEVGAGGRDAILAPGDICMLASWAAYSCCGEEEEEEEQKKRQAVTEPFMVYILPLVLLASSEV
ncbi:hypothetical protein EYF80_046106 [Liparis tanakae]|uniref:Uncharacterized protein n=1 Tax=Liparis tanakae TaxID=230148 RepID=A0A4Z2FRA5_9TELE|nr:hypothetical protein EYF80_046106 [Liparis tanakae]